MTQLVVPQQKPRAPQSSANTQSKHMLPLWMSPV